MSVVSWSRKVAHEDGADGNGSEAPVLLLAVLMFDARVKKLWKVFLTCDPRLTGSQSLPGAPCVFVNMPIS